MHAHTRRGGLPTLAYRSLFFPPPGGGTERAEREKKTAAEDEGGVDAEIDRRGADLPGDMETPLYGPGTRGRSQRNGSTSIAPERQRRKWK